MEILIEDVHLLVVPSPHGDDDPEESERRMQATKAERLENAELLHMRGRTNVEGVSPIFSLSQKYHPSATRRNPSATRLDSVLDRKGCK